MFRPSFIISHVSGGNADLHIVDTAGHFSAPSFLDLNRKSYGQSVDGIWLAFLQICLLHTLDFATD